MYEGMQQTHGWVMLILPNRSYQTLGANHKKVLGHFEVNAKSRILLLSPFFSGSVQYAVRLRARRKLFVLLSHTPH